MQPLDGPMMVSNELVYGSFDGGKLTRHTATASGLTPDGRVEVALVPDRWQALVIGAGALPAFIVEDLWAVLRGKSALAQRRLAGAMLPRHHEPAADALRVLDALTMTDTGAVLAAVTTSLPETVRVAMSASWPPTVSSRRRLPPGRARGRAGLRLGVVGSRRRGPRCRRVALPGRLC